MKAQKSDLAQPLTCPCLHRVKKGTVSGGVACHEPQRPTPTPSESQPDNKRRVHACASLCRHTHTHPCLHTSASHCRRAQTKEQHSLSGEKPCSACDCFFPAQGKCKVLANVNDAPIFWASPVVAIEDAAKNSGPRYPEILAGRPQVATREPPTPDGSPS